MSGAEVSGLATNQIFNAYKPCKQLYLDIHRGYQE